MKSLININWFIPDKYKESEDSERKARYFVNACTFTTAFSFFYFLVSLFFKMEMPMWAMVHNTVAIGSLPFYLRRGLSISILGNLFIFLGTLGVTWTLFFTGGFTSGTIVWYTVLPIASLLLINKNSSYVWTAVCMAFVIMFGILKIMDVQLENQIPLEHLHVFNLSAIGGVVLMLFLIALIFETTRDNAYKQLRNKNKLLSIEKKRSDDLLLNILPEEVAKELKAKGKSEPKLFDDATVLFTDFKEFTVTSESLTPEELVSDLNNCFSAFDKIIQKYNIEKIKTIGDAYMAVGGLPTPSITHTKDVVRAALEISEFISNGKAKKIAQNLPYFEIRIGIHTGPVVAGIVGVKKFQYDIWGDTVNTASRIESNGTPGKVNISESTYQLLKDDTDFTFESRGKIEAKGKGLIDMYFIDIVH
ncbi:MAG: adenylate/guanylate cyclase domain-containing protein [Chlorobiota bacterium]